MWHLGPVIPSTQELESGDQGFRVSLGYPGSSLGYTDSNEKRHREKTRAELSLGTAQPVTPMPGVHAPAPALCKHPEFKVMSVIQEGKEAAGA